MMHDIKKELKGRGGNAPSAGGSPTLCAVSIKGSSHAYQRRPCEDVSRASLVSTPSGSVCVVATADGVSSCDHPLEAARTAVDAAIDDLANEFGRLPGDCDATYAPWLLEGMLAHASLRALEALHDEARRNRCDVRQYATTFDLSVFLPNAHFAAFAHAGDSAILVKKVEGSFELATSQRKGPMGGSSVVPFSEAGTWSFGSATNAACVVHVTDGVLDAVAPKTTGGQRMVKQDLCQALAVAASRGEQALASALKEPPFTRSSDDLTAAVASSDPCLIPSARPGHGTGTRRVRAERAWPNDGALRIGVIVSLVLSALALAASALAIVEAVLRPL